MVLRVQDHGTKEKQTKAFRLDYRKKKCLRKKDAFVPLVRFL